MNKQIKQTNKISYVFLKYGFRIYGSSYLSISHPYILTNETHHFCERKALLANYLN